MMEKQARRTDAPPPDATDPEEVEVYYCPECSTLSRESGGPLYECDDCGSRFNRMGSADGHTHRCPDCSKFGRRVAQMSCAECDKGELEPIAAVECPTCLELIATDDWDDHKLEHVTGGQE